MAENTQLVEQPERKIGPVQQVKLLLNEDTVKKRFTDVADDQKTFDEDGNEEYGDNQPDVIEAEDPFAQIEDKSGEQDDEPEELDITQ